MNLGDFIRETSNGFSHISIYDRLVQERKIFFTEEVNSKSANELIASLMALETEDSSEPITLFINSPGGEVDSGLAVYDVITRLKVPVDTVCIGTAASMASIIFLAGRNRCMYEHTKIMIHDPLLTGMSSVKKALELEKEAKRLMEVRDMLGGIISQRTGRTLKEVLGKTKENCFFSAEEALKFGIATEIFYNENNL